MPHIRRSTFGVEIPEEGKLSMPYGSREVETNTYATNREISFVESTAVMKLREISRKRIRYGSAVLGMSQNAFLNEALESFFTEHKEEASELVGLLVSGDMTEYYKRLREIRAA